MNKIKNAFDLLKKLFILLIAFIAFMLISLIELLPVLSIYILFGCFVWIFISEILGLLIFGITLILFMIRAFIDIVDSTY